jgi:FkbM family methyltransferase
MAVVLDAEKTALDLYAEAWYVAGHRGDPFIVDVGANVGEWYVAARERFPLSRIACFEPQRGAQKALLNYAAGDPRMAVVRLGLSSHDHEATLMAEQQRVERARHPPRAVGSPQLPRHRRRARP